MKYVIVLPDGAADEPLPQLEGLTPLQAARIPAMDHVASHGVMGRTVTIPKGFTPGTDVGTMALLSYDPHLYYSGRAPIEAAARHIQARPDQLIFRCNFVTVHNGCMADFTAGHIHQDESEALIAALNAALGDAGCEFVAGVSYRNLMLLSGADDVVVKTKEPHDIPDQAVAYWLPRGQGAARVLAVMERAHAVVAAHEVNRRRSAEGRAPVSGIWLWGQGRPKALPPFGERFGVRAAVITGVDILRGLAVASGMDLIPVPGATGYIDTDYDAKGRAAITALERHDVVIVHVEAADEAGHLGSATEKVKALERIDEAIVAPLLEALPRLGPWRMLVAPDHPTPVSTKAHSAVPPPFCYAGSDVAASCGRPFTEADADACGLWVDPAHDLMARFLDRPAKQAGS